MGFLGLLENNDEIIKEDDWSPADLIEMEGFDCGRTLPVISSVLIDGQAPEDF